MPRNREMVVDEVDISVSPSLTGVLLVITSEQFNIALPFDPQSALDLADVLINAVETFASGLPS